MFYNFSKADGDHQYISLNRISSSHSRVSAAALAATQRGRPRKWASRTHFVCGAGGKFRTHAERDALRHAGTHIPGRE